MPPCDSTNRDTPAPTSSSTSSSSVGGDGRRHGNAARRSGRGSRPTASQSPATARHAAAVAGRRRRGRQDDARRAGGERQPDRRRRPRGRRRAGAARPTATRPRRPPRGWPGAPARRAVEVDEVDDPRAQRDEPLGDPLRPVGRRADAGRGAGPEDDPRAAALEVDRRDDAARGVRAPSPASSRRWKLIGSDPLRSSVSWKPRSENASPSRRCSSARSWSSSTRPSR